MRTLDDNRRASHEAPEGTRWLEYPLVSVVITGYRRPIELRKTVESFLRQNSYPNVELILADDASPEDLRTLMRVLPFNKFLFSETNLGLGANANRGLAAADADFVLQLQDDWLCDGPSDFLLRAVRLLQSNPEIGFVRLVAPQATLPFSSHRLADGTVFRTYRPLPGTDVFVYSDQPHLKTKAFIRSIGPYLEDRYMQRTEIDMRNRFNAQSRYVAAFLEGFSVFRHIGEGVSHRKPLPLARIGGIMDRVVGLRQAAQLFRAVRRYRRRNNALQ